MAFAEEFGKNAATVLALLRYLPESLKDLPIHIPMDNPFTSFQLLSKLKDIYIMKLQVQYAKTI